MFQPTVSIGGPTEMLQQGQPVQSFRGGGQVIGGVKYFQEGGLNTIPRFIPGEETIDMRAPSQMGLGSMRLETPPPVTGETPAAPGPRYVPKTPIMRSIYGLFEATPARQASVQRALDERAREEAAARAREENPVPTIFSEVTDEERAAAIARQAAAVRAIGPSREAIAAAISRQAIDDVDERGRPTRGTVAPPVEAPPAATAPASDRPANSIKVNLDEIKAERAAERRENGLLALMQAGLAIAGGRSPNAISNIGAGGQAGLASFAAMERASREDAAARRREAVQLASAERQFSLAERQLEKDPEAVRTYAILGGFKPGDSKEAYQTAVTRGFGITQSKEGPKLAAAIINNPLSSQFYSSQELKDLADYARRGIIGMGTGGDTAALPTVRLAPNQGQR
jgi:hypothetical protein